MALSQLTRNRLHLGLASRTAGDDVADVVDAGSGTLTAHTRDRLNLGAVSRLVGGGIADAVDAGTALTSRESTALSTILASRTAGQEIADVLSA